MTEMTISESASRLEELVRRVADSRELIALTDEGRVTALLVAPQVIEDLEDSVAVAGYRRRKAEGTLTEGIPHAEVGRILGLRP
ncbi:type II toxin-antitoxin system prevent-host-death family antitoxin [Streptomyces lancefieldiae]|uniref:Type II toxin-antitoxin system prevent-host-death family antitoxin n=1 Tax=Streptomyces lancefieldiae TaxID=3075520 RepID=A0ABU3AJ26_9ACTN|nr:type II toxin-antitoxin system prevent-host-death family antitoxin [Streptomyces sp. DSM 40712]MDT0609989.1 type II toxin-antitoxin system prevent-host-death family antitoxin [Streptomyces sp. DSM 40712]